jgi:hypothetical protein
VRRARKRGIAALAALAPLAAVPAAAESARVPSLVGTLGRFPTVPGGRAYLVQVPGSAHSPLDDAALASVLNWMVARFALEADAAAFPPYDAAEVATHRANPLVDVAAARAELLRRMASGD